MSKPNLQIYSNDDYEMTYTVNGVDFIFVRILLENGEILEMGKYPCTQEQWDALGFKNKSHFNNPKNPVENVNWFQAMECGEILSALSCRIGFTLPTEELWELAARADTPEYKYSGSNNPEDVAWYGKNSGEATHEVGQKKPNSWGLYDMSGNVWEWTSSAYDKGENKKDSFRVYRGGSWYDGAGCARVAYRLSFPPSFRLGLLGFRLSRIIPIEELEKEKENLNLKAYIAKKK